MELNIVRNAPDWVLKTTPSVTVDFQKIEPCKIEGDGSDYVVLWNAAKEIIDVPGLILEIGVRVGMGSFVMMQACVENEDTDRAFFGVDCYGSWSNNYPNLMKTYAKKTLYEYAYYSNLDYTLIELEDHEFFARYSDGIPLYNRTVWESQDYKPEDYEWKRIVNEYALVHLDGPHRMLDVISESNFFMPRMSIGGIIVYDDIDKPEKYNHDDFEPLLFQSGFELLEKQGSKASYRRVK